jgi:signal transduction histidine kinase
MLSLISGIIASIMILILFLIRMNSILDKNIKERTKELEESNNSLLILNEKLEYSNKQLQIHDKMQKEFISTAAHELRTPIQPILGFSKIVKDRVQDNEQKGLLDIVIKNTNRLKRLTEDILDVTRIEGNKLLLKKELVCLWEILHSVIKDFEHSLENNNKNIIRFNLYFKNIDLNTIILADKNRIAQVISNLIDNSIKFISTENRNEENGKGLISITVEKTKINSNKNDNVSDEAIDGIIISIKDNGKGIDEEIFPRLCTKFASKSFQGTGLGLYISKNIVEVHGGKIWAKNNEDGKGATFSFSLPITDNCIK